MGNGNYRELLRRIPFLMQMPHNPAQRIQVEQILRRIDNALKKSETPDPKIIESMAVLTDTVADLEEELTTVKIEFAALKKQNTNLKRKVTNLEKTTTTDKE